MRLRALLTKPGAYAVGERVSGGPVSRRAVLAVSTLGAGFVAGTGGSFLTKVGLRHRGEFLPGVRVDGVDLSGMAPQAALAIFERRWREYMDSPVIFRAPDRAWKPTAQEMGVAIDYLTPLREAYAWGREGGMFQRAREQAAAVTVSRNWPVKYSFDREKLQHYLASVASLYYQPAVDAEIEIRDGALLLRPGNTGVELDWRSAYGLVREPSGSAVPQEIELPFVRTASRFSTEDAEKVAGAVESMVSQPLVLLFEEKGWLVEQQLLLDALRLNRVGDRLIPVFDDSKFQPLLDEIDQRLSMKPVDGVINYDEALRRVAEFVPPRDGRVVDRKSLTDRIFVGATFGESKIDIPVVAMPASRSDAGNTGISDLVATGESFFMQSPSYRIHNIETGSMLLNGSLIKPDEEFSFNDFLGPVTYKRGFVDGLVIIEDRTEQAIGGGICQVSTTLFRAAFWAGTPILERHKHIYRVRYYEQGNFPIGFDASIWQPSLDMRFANDTGAPMMIRTVFDRRKSSLKFELWGKKTDRKVEISDHQLSDWKDPPPDEWVVDEKLEEGKKEQTEWAVKGVYAVLTRRVSLGTKALSETSFPSSFTAWPNRYAVSPDVAEKEAPEAYAEWLAKKAEEEAKKAAGEGDGADEGEEIAKKTQTSGY